MFTDWDLEGMLDQVYIARDSQINGSKVIAEGYMGIVMKASEKVIGKEKGKYVFGYWTGNELSPIGYVILDPAMIRTIDQEAHVIDLEWPFGGSLFSDPYMGFGQTIFEALTAHRVPKPKIQIWTPRRSRNSSVGY
jgi:hypothetical protein